MKDPTQKGGGDDFVVFPSNPMEPAYFIDSVKDILATLKSAEIKSRKLEHESNEAFAIRVALSSYSIKSALFRKNTKADAARISAWIGLVREASLKESLSSQISFNNDFGIADVGLVAQLSRDPEHLSMLREFLRDEYGIIMTLERAFTSMHMDGCAFRLENGVPVVALTLRYERYDYFWFTLLHELAHVALHYQQLIDPIFEDLSEDSEEIVEIEANRLAFDSLISRADARRFFRQGYISNADQLREEAARLDIHPAILAGLYRFHVKRYDLFSSVGQELNVRAIFGMQ